MESLSTKAVTKMIAYYASEVVKYRDQNNRDDMIFCAGLLHGHLFALLCQSVDVKKVCVDACKLVDKNIEMIKIIMATYQDVKDKNDQILGAMLINDALER